VRSWLLSSVWDDLAQLACTEPRRSGRDYSVGRAGRAPVTSQLITPALMRLVQQHAQAAIEVELKARSYFLCIPMNALGQLVVS